MVERKEYLDQLWAWKDERQIKVVTGIRRCGNLYFWNSISRDSWRMESHQNRLFLSTLKIWITNP